MVFILAGISRNLSDLHYSLPGHLLVFLGLKKVAQAAYGGGPILVKWLPESFEMVPNGYVDISRSSLVCPSDKAP
jgi:hypothetical protein